MKFNKLMKLLTGRGEIKEQLIFQCCTCGLLVLLGLAMQGIQLLNISVINNMSENAERIFESLSGILIVIGIVRIIKNISIMKSNEILNAYKTELRDERNINITRRALSSAVVICVWIGLIVSGIFLGINEVVSTTIMYSMCVFLIIYLFFRFIFSKIM